MEHSAAKRMVRQINGPGDIYIAGTRTADDWIAFRQKLTVGGERLTWKQAFDDYFRARLDLRYLRPIRILQESGGCEGEGFAIVAVQCTLIEFLASTLKGKTYRYVRRNDPPLGKHEYSDSKRLFVEFLTSARPFKGEFNDEISLDFYASVRCGLLHEARTKNGWTIRSGRRDGRMIDAASNTLQRDNLQRGLEAFVEQFGRDLQVQRPQQEAFLRKFDSLCQ